MSDSVVSSPEGNATETRARDAVNVEVDHHDLYRKWTIESKGAEGRGGEQLFPNMPAMFVFAAALGQAMGVTRPLKKKVYVFKWVSFSEQEDVPILEALAVANTNDLTVLDNRTKILDIAEEYATGGVDLLRQELTASREKNLERLAKLALEVAQKTLPGTAA